MHGRDTGAQPLTAQVIDNGGSWTLQLSDPVGGTATVNLFKGMTSTGGSIALGGAAPIPLNERVQGISVTAAGPVWESDDVLMRDGFEGY